MLGKLTLVYCKPPENDVLTDPNTLLMCLYIDFIVLMLMTGSSIAARTWALIHMQHATTYHRWRGAVLECHMSTAKLLAYTRAAEEAFSPSATCKLDGWEFRRLVLSRTWFYTPNTCNSLLFTPFSSCSSRAPLLSETLIRKMTTNLVTYAAYGLPEVRTYIRLYRASDCEHIIYAFMQVHCEEQRQNNSQKSYLT